MTLGDIGALATVVAWLFGVYVSAKPTIDPWAQLVARKPYSLPLLLVVVRVAPHHPPTTRPAGMTAEQEPAAADNRAERKAKGFP